MWQPLAALALLALCFGTPAPVQAEGIRALEGAHHDARVVSDVSSVEALCVAFEPEAPSSEDEKPGYHSADLTFAGAAPVARKRIRSVHLAVSSVDYARPGLPRGPPAQRA